MPEKPHGHTSTRPEYPAFRYRRKGGAQRSEQYLDGGEHNRGLGAPRLATRARPANCDSRYQSIQVATMLATTITATLQSIILIRR